MTAQELEKYVFAEGKIQPPYRLPISKVRFALHPHLGKILTVYGNVFITYRPTEIYEFDNAEDAFVALNREIDGIYLLEVTRI